MAVQLNRGGGGGKGPAIKEKKNFKKLFLEKKISDGH